MALNKIARETGFLRRESKLKPEEFIGALLFSEFDHSRLSLQDCCNELAQYHQKPLSKVAMHKRFNLQSFGFLKAVLAKQMALKLNILECNMWQPFTRVMIADSCKFALPERYKADYPGFGGSRSKALMNIQYAFDLKQGDWETLELAQANENDKAYSKKTLNHIVEGDLHIRDLGYITHGYLAEVSTKKAFFLNRLPPTWKPFERATGNPIDWVALYQKMQTAKLPFFETMVAAMGKSGTAVDCRLVAMLVPEKVWVERIRKAQARAKSVGYTLTEEYKQRCRFSVFITNATEGMLKATEIVDLYRLRWQVELVFKTWKSVLDMQKVKPVKKERLECQLIAKFIWILLNWKVFRVIDSFVKENSSGYACSMWKFFKQAKHDSNILKLVIKSKLPFEYWCKVLIASIIQNLLIEPRKGKKAGYEIVNDIFRPLS